jgi:hypothetical protein
MAFILKCPGCQSPLRIRAEYAGKQLKCPRCTHLIAIPANLVSLDKVAAEPPAEEPPPPPPREEIKPVRKAPRPAPAEQAIEEGEPPPVPRGRRRRDDDYEDDDRDDRRGRKRFAYKPCPRCKGTDATKVVWTFWGSFYGPAMFNHVRCDNCGATYNGRTGRSNVIPAIIFVTIPALLISLIIGGLLWLILARLR